MSAALMRAPQGALAPPTSTLTQQLEHQDGEKTPKASKTRSLSDAAKPTLSPSPAFREPSRRVSKDDLSVTNPSTPKRSHNHSRGLSLQMPTRDPLDSSMSTSIQRIPLSPKLDPSNTYGSPTSMLPRRSRGLDFARACTHLHHSTLAESSPDASPIVGRGILIPQRRSVGNNTVLDSPSNISNHMWSNGPGDRTTLSSSVSSINMMDSDTDSDDSSEDMVMDRDMEDPILNTPAASRLNGIGVFNSPGMEWMNNQPNPVQTNPMTFTPSLMNFRRARLRKGKSAHSSSSVSMRSSKASPGGPLSPPLRPSVESGGYFGLTKQQVRSRRESLSIGAGELHLSDSEDGDMRGHGSSGNDGSSERGVVRRAVTRRSNLLPKTKGFARIRAQLMEDADPLHSEARREAEVIRQVQESEPELGHKSSSSILDPSSVFTAEPINSIEGLGMTQGDEQEVVATTTEPFSQQAKRNSGGIGFWNKFDGRYRTPPPPLLNRDNSGPFSDEASETTISSSDNPSLRHLHRPRSRSRSSTPLASNANTQTPPTAGDVARKVNNKRRRDDDFDPASFKRRAVSPGMSAQSSPVIPQSPVMGGEKGWGRPPNKTHNDRSNSGGSNAGAGVKRIGLQGMTETSEGLMSMSID